MTAFAENAAETQITAIPEQTIGTESAETPLQDAALAAPHLEEASSQVSALAGVVTAGTPVDEPLAEDTQDLLDANPTDEEIQNMFAQLDLEIMNAKGKTPIQYIDFDKPLMWLNPGETGRTSFTIYPESARNEEITWDQIDGKDIVDMVEPGVFKANRVGNAGFYLKNHGESVGYVSVYVGEGSQPATSIIVTPKNITVRAGEIFKADAQMPQAPAAQSVFVIKIPNPDLVSILIEGGHYYANGVGETDIKYYTYNGVTDTCHVTILPSEDPNFGKKPNLLKIFTGNKIFKANVG
ncbi:MAG: hypothetical protein RSF70_03645, partial [Ruthenibacterium sp.]